MSRLLEIALAGTLVAAMHAVPASAASQPQDPSPTVVPEWGSEDGSSSTTSTARASASTSSWSDVPSTHWAKTAIDYVAASRDWMRDFGTSTFKPETVETKRLFARALVKAFDPAGTVDPTITFPDVATTDPDYRVINIAAKHGWLPAAANGYFRPGNGVTTTMVHRGLVLAKGLHAEVNGLANLKTADGRPLAIDPARFPYNVLGMNLGLRTNHTTETEDVLPTTALKRDEVAYSLYKAAIAQQWQLDALKPFATIKLPWGMADSLVKVVEFGAKYVAYPYVWGGEWHTASPSGYCCGTQPIGGFDCSGLMWWTMKSPAGGYSNSSIRGYTGWSLPERSSSQMSAVGAKLSYADKRPGDLMFYDSPYSTVISHVNLYIGNGWALDSSSGRGGASIIRITSGYYYDQFRWARKII